MTNALLIHGGAVGDLVMSLRIVAAMREAGAARVTVLGKPEIAAIAVPGGGVDAVIDMNQGGYYTLFSRESPLPPPILNELRQFELAIDMLGGPTGAPTAKLRQAGILRVIAIDPRPRSDWPGHISDQWLADLRAAGIQAAPGPPLILLPRERRDEARRCLCKATGLSDEPIAILHPGSGSRRKCWPPADFIELARNLQARGWGAAFLLGHVEMELFTAGEIAMFHAAAPTITDRPLREAAVLIAATDLFIGNDSGISHLAAALATPIIAIFGSTDPRLWRPLGDHVTCMSPKPSVTWPSVEDVANVVSDVAQQSLRPCSGSWSETE